jgi:D-alanyl-lipoteichoic acid acyltransferase DltB (MBOAT superfamily)
VNTTLFPLGDKELLINLAIIVLSALSFSIFSVFGKKIQLLTSVAAAAAWHGQAFVGFALVSGLAYLTIYRISLTAPPLRWRFTVGSMLALIAVFNIGRVFQWNLDLLPTRLPIALYSLGMWQVLRLLTLFWETGSGSAAPSLPRFVCWVCLPVTLGGPLLRYSQMPPDIITVPSLWVSTSWWVELAGGLLRFTAGSLISALPATLSYRLPSHHYLNSAVTALIATPVGFYLWMSGYFRIMETLGRTCGLIIPPSFNRPFGRENISLFWSNWNMTASSVFRDYLFYNRWGLRSYSVYFNILVVFILLGIWHGAYLYWVLWGLMHGLLFCGFVIWRTHGLRMRPTTVGPTKSKIAARVLTYVLVCACWYLPSKILSRFGIV